MKARIPFLLYFIFFHSSNTTTEHSASDAGGINDYFMRSAYAKAGATATATSAALRQQFLNSDFTACPKAIAPAAPRREPETILLDESEEAEGAAENAEEGRPIPVQIGHRPGDAMRFLKRHLPNSDLDYFPDNYTDADRTSATKLRISNV